MIHLTVGMLRNGKHDPTTMIDADNLWRASYTPDGPGAVHITGLSTSQVDAVAFGPGGNWLLTTVEDMLGHTDHVPHIESCHHVVTQAQQRYGDFRFPRSHNPYHELLPAVLGQRVTAIEAMRQWRDLCVDLGEKAPGQLQTLHLPPSPEAILKTPYFVFHQYGIEQKRAMALKNVARHFPWLMQLSQQRDISPSQRTQELTKIPGIGQWTAATSGAVAFGDPDALLVGDFHVKNNVSYALTGRARGSDEQMVELLRPYDGQRARVVKWLDLYGIRAPKFGPRQRIRSIVNR